MIRPLEHLNMRSRRVSKWSRLPLPFLSRLCAFLRGNDLQRAADILGWPQSFKSCDAFKRRLKEFSREQRDNPFSSARPRRHRDYYHMTCHCALIVAWLTRLASVQDAKRIRVSIASHITTRLEELLSGAATAATIYERRHIAQIWKHE